MTPEPDSSSLTPQQSAALASCKDAIEWARPMTTFSEYEGVVLVTKETSTTRKLDAALAQIEALAGKGGAK